MAIAGALRLTVEIERDSFEQCGVYTPVRYCVIYPNCVIW